MRAKEPRDSLLPSGNQLSGTNLSSYHHICEVAPCYDPTNMTSVVAANLMFELLCVLADWRATRTKNKV